jgi:putative membrane protein
LSLFGMLLLASVTFVVLHFALTSLFGNIGRWVSAGFAIVAVAVSVTAAVPGWLGLLRPISPLSPALEGIRDVMTSQSPMNAVLGLSGWLVLGLLGCTAAVIRSRKVPVAEVLSVR